MGFLTAADTKGALERIRTASSLSGCPLLEMGLVSRRLQSAGFAITQEGLEWALAGLLSEVAEAELTRLRAESARGRPARQRVDAEAPSLALDFELGSVELEAWSSMYHRYLAAPTLQMQEIAAIARPGQEHGRRHINRRVTLGIRLMTDALYEQEGEHQSAVIASTRVRRHNLPARHSSFVNRHEDLASLAELLSRRALVTLVGPGGVGKTRLALQVASAQVESFDDGVWLVELDAVNEPAAVPYAVVAAINVAERVGGSAMESLKRELADREMLLVLDNCEHVVDACAQLVEDLLGTCQGLRILATSRQALGVEGEHVRQVSPLSVPGDSLPVRVEGVRTFAAAELFIDRASAVNSQFVLTGDDVPATALLCRRLDGLPLAIELAAARAGTMPVREILNRVGGRLDLLGGSRRGTGRRRETLSGAIDWSYDLLSDEEQRAYERLSVFRGGWTIDAAESVIGGDRVAASELLMQLVAKSLVTAGVVDWQARYTMLETIREHASLKLKSLGTLGTARSDHQSYFARLAEDSELLLEGPHQADVLNSLDREHDNFVAAIEASELGVREAAVGMLLVGHIARFWQLRGRLSQGRRLGDLVLGVPANADASLPRARALVGIGELAYQQGDYSAALARVAEALEIFRQECDVAGTASAVRSMGKLADARGDYAGARVHYLEALRLYELLDNEWGIAASRNNLGLLALREGDSAAARASLKSSLDSFRRLGDRWAVGVTLSNLGDIAEVNGDLDAARELFTESLGIAREMDDRDGVAYALTALGNVAAQAGDVANAREYLVASLDVLRLLEAKPAIAEWLEACATLALAVSDGDRAARLFGAASGLRDDIAAPLAPKDQGARDRAVAALRDQLGEGRLAAAWDIGRSLSRTAALELALEVLTT